MIKEKITFFEQRPPATTNESFCLTCMKITFSKPEKLIDCVSRPQDMISQIGWNEESIIKKYIQTYIGRFEIPMCDIDQLNFKFYWDWGGNLKVETLVYMFTITISRNLGQTNLG